MSYPPLCMSVFVNLARDCDGTKRWQRWGYEFIGRGIDAGQDEAKPGPAAVDPARALLWACLAAACSCSAVGDTAPAVPTNETVRQAYGRRMGIHFQDENIRKQASQHEYAPLVTAQADSNLGICC